MTKSQKHKEEIVAYLKEHKPRLLGNQNKYKKIKECGNVLKFRKYANGEKHLHSGGFCKYDKMCIACATRRAILQIQKFEKGIKENGLEKMYRYHITPTVRHNKRESLEQVMDKLYTAKEKLATDYRNSKRDTQRAKSFFSQFDGMVMSTEVSYSEKSGYHPHLHILACSKEPLDTERSNFMKTMSNKELQKERHKYTEGDALNIGMKSIGVQKNHFNRKGLGEVFKYVVKNSQLQTPQLVELLELQQKRRYRFLSTYGVCRGWKNVKKKDRKMSLEKVFVYGEKEYGVLE